MLSCNNVLNFFPNAIKLLQELHGFMKTIQDFIIKAIVNIFPTSVVDFAHFVHGLVAKI